MRGSEPPLPKVSLAFSLSVTATIAGLLALLAGHFNCVTTSNGMKDSMTAGGGPSGGSASNQFSGLLQTSIEHISPLIQNIRQAGRPAQGHGGEATSEARAQEQKKPSRPDIRQGTYLGTYLGKETKALITKEFKCPITNSTTTS